MLYIIKQKATNQAAALDDLRVRTCWYTLTFVSANQVQHFYLKLRKVPEHQKKKKQIYVFLCLDRRSKGVLTQFDTNAACLSLD